MTQINEKAAAGRRNRVRERELLYERRKRRRKRMLRSAAVLFFTAIVTLLIIITVFKVKKVEVSGNHIYANDKIKEWILNDEYSDNSLYVYLKYRFFEPEELPFVNSMEISLTPPGTLRIRVIEKAILGYLYLDQIGQNVYFDREGFVVEMSPEAIKDVPRITGIEVDRIVLYEKLPIKKERKVLKDLLILTQTLKKYEVVPETIHYTAGSGYEMMYHKVAVNLGQAEYLNDKIIRLAEVLPMIEGQSGILHLENIDEHSRDMPFEKIDDNE